MQKSDFTKSSFGRLITTVEGHLAFIPRPLPPSLDWTPELIDHLSQAEWAIGRLSGVGFNIPNPHLLIRPFIRREAVLSSKIEGTQSEMEDLYLFEMEPQREPRVPDAREVANYVRALNYGLKRIKKLPISLRLIRELHQRLMKGVRGQHDRPGDFRTSQNWIGSVGYPIEQATYVPPPPQEMINALDAWEKFLHYITGNIRPLIRLAMIHYQFEAIHPFRDGNGRIGRLLITLLMCTEGILRDPLLYLSAYFEKNRQAYYNHLLKVSTEGRWTEWILFFLRGVVEQSKDAFERSRKLLALRDTLREQVYSARSSAITTKLIDELFLSPIITTKKAARDLKASPVAAQNNIDKLAKAGVLKEITGWKRNRIYLAEAILRTIDEPITID